MNSSLHVGSIFHQRTDQFKYFFKYKTLNLLINLNKINELNKIPIFSINEFNIFSFNFKNHGYRKSEINPIKWITYNLKNKYKDKKNYEIYLYCTPSFFGYVFNPISTYLCIDTNDKIKYICYEVKNTHYEQHSYFVKVKKKNNYKINKIFYVSPFLEMNLKYKFFLKSNDKFFNLKVDVYKNNNLILKTGLLSKSYKLTTFNLLLQTFFNLFNPQKVMILIHYQAFKIFNKSKIFFSKPIKRFDTISFHE